MSYIPGCFILLCSDMDCLHDLVGFHDTLLLTYENGFTPSLEVVYPLPKDIFLLSNSIYAGCYMYLYVLVYVQCISRLVCYGLCLARYAET